MKKAPFVFTALLFLGGFATNASALLVPQTYPTYLDTNTNKTWLKLDGFFNNTLYEITPKIPDGYHIAWNYEVNKLFDNFLEMPLEDFLLVIGAKPDSLCSGDPTEPGCEPINWNAAQHWQRDGSKGTYYVPGFFASADLTDNFSRDDNVSAWVVSNSVPEPITASLFGFGITGLILKRRKN